MDIFQLKIFLAISREGGFSKAAAKLNLTQPTISHRILSLERELDVKLFERQGHYITLTNYGKVLLPYAEKINSLLNESQEIIQKEKTIANDRLCLGVPLTIGVYIFPFILERFFPNVANNLEISIFTAPSTKLGKMLTDNLIDAAFISHPVDLADAVYVSLFKEELIVVTSPDHHLAGLNKLSLEEIVPETLITFHRDTNYRQRIEQVFGQDYTKLHLIEADNIAALKQFVIKNYGISILPRCTVLEELNGKQLTTIPLYPKVSQFELDVQFVYRSSNPLSKPLKLLISNIGEFASNPQKWYQRTADIASN